MRMLSVFFIFLTCVFLNEKTHELILSPQNIYPSQYLDEQGFVYPWLTKTFLDVLKTWDIRNWEVFEWGTGYSTVWFALHCKHITSVDNDKKWADAVKDYLTRLNLKNYTIKVRTPGPYSYGEKGEQSDYVLAIEEDEKKYDCILIDGQVHRNTCAKHTPGHIKSGSVIILDNVNNGMDNNSTFELLKKHSHYVCVDKENKIPGWRTDYWIIQ